MKRTQINLDLKQELQDRLAWYSIKSGMSKSEIIRRALREYLRNPAPYSGAYNKDEKKDKK